MYNCIQSTHCRNRAGSIQIVIGRQAVDAICTSRYSFWIYYSLILFTYTIRINSSDHKPNYRNDPLNRHLGESFHMIRKQNINESIDGLFKLLTLLQMNNTIESHFYLFLRNRENKSHTSFQRGKQTIILIQLEDTKRNILPSYDSERHSMPTQTCIHYLENQTNTPIGCLRTIVLTVIPHLNSNEIWTVIKDLLDNLTENRRCRFEEGYSIRGSTSIINTRLTIISIIISITQTYTKANRHFNIVASNISFML